MEAALKALGKKNDIKVLAIGGDGATTDIGFGELSGVFERGHDFTYICMDNEAYMNTGVQRSSGTTTMPAPQPVLPENSLLEILTIKRICLQLWQPTALRM